MTCDHADWTSVVTITDTHTHYTCLNPVCGLEWAEPLQPRTEPDCG